ncbi:MAG TPA: biopolymer transporter ExbD [Thermoanaerobaculia bacterium]|nr:biopolymer transporter ExbD [Thermoanaerobaculia bacterium]
MRSQINVTPLVDVCLVLLIIFMVVTPLPRSAVEVALPETAHPKNMAQVSNQLTVSIKSDGSVYFEWAGPARGRLSSSSS